MIKVLACNIKKVSPGHLADQQIHLLIVPIEVHLAPSYDSRIRLECFERHVLGKHLLAVQGVD